MSWKREVAQVASVPTVIAAVLLASALVGGLTIRVFFWALGL